jgi:hypothetical protein
MNAPIALFVYSRPEHTRRTLEALMQNIGAAESELYIFCDGPKINSSPEKLDTIKKVRSIAAEKKWCKNVYIKESSENKGLARSIIDGVNSVLHNSNTIIILEDDMETSPWFLTFMNDALAFYENDERVASITGFTWPVKGSLPETFFLRGTYCWGWATWRRAWKVFDEDGKKLLAELEQKNLTTLFDFDNSYHYTEMLRNQTLGINDSWALRWYAAAFLKDMLTLIPGRSLVQNIGFDGSGTHCVTSKEWFVHLSQTKIEVAEIPVIDHPVARRRVTAFFRAIRHRRRLYMRAFNKLLRILKLSDA